MTHRIRSWVFLVRSNTNIVLHVLRQSAIHQNGDTSNKFRQEISGARPRFQTLNIGIDPADFLGRASLWVIIRYELAKPINLKLQALFADIASTMWRAWICLLLDLFHQHKSKLLDFSGGFAPNTISELRF